MATLKSLSDEMAQMVETVGASLVRVDARRRLPASGVVYSADGVIVTSHHVVQTEEGIHVGLPDGRNVEAQFIGRDPSTDLAVLKVDAEGLMVPTWVEAADVAVGHMVLALGRPGDTVQATLGVVSALSEGAWRAPTGGSFDRYLQTDVTMYPGFSGGPLAGAAGGVLGINTSALMRGTSLTIPTGTIVRVVSTLMEHGHIRRGYLGVSAQAVRLPEDVAESASQETGLLVASVESGSPAADGGVLLGDTIVSLDGQPTRSMDELMGLLMGDRVGQSVPVTVVRGGAMQDLAVTVGEREERAETEDDGRTWGPRGPMGRRGRRGSWGR